MIKNILENKHLIPKKILLTRGYSYIEISISTYTPISEIKAMHIKTALEEMFYCRADMEYSDFALKLFVRELEPCNINYKQLYEASRFNDIRKLLVGIDINNYLIDIDLNKTKKIIRFHGEQPLNNSILNYIKCNYVLFSEEKLYRNSVNNLANFDDLLNYENQTDLIIIQIVTNTYLYNKDFIAILNKLLCNKKLNIIFETSNICGIDSILNLFDCKIVSGLNSSHFSKTLISNREYFGNYYDSNDMLIIFSKENKIIRCQQLITD